MVYGIPMMYLNSTFKQKTHELGYVLKPIWCNYDYIAILAYSLGTNRDIFLVSLQIPEYFQWSSGKILRIRIQANLLQRVNCQHFSHLDIFCFRMLFSYSSQTSSTPYPLAPPPTRSTMAASRSWFICSELPQLWSHPGRAWCRKNGSLYNAELYHLLICAAIKLASLGTRNI